MSANPEPITNYGARRSGWLGFAANGLGFLRRLLLRRLQSDKSLEALAALGDVDLHCLSELVRPRRRVFRSEAERGGRSSRLGIENPVHPARPRRDQSVRHDEADPRRHSLSGLPATAEPGKTGSGEGSRAASFPIAASAALETGDTWVQGPTRLRLYGVQACIRGTIYVNGSGQRLDCGDASLAMLAALIKDTRPECVPIAQQPGLQTFVTCSAILESKRVELGTMLITSGFAFAALKADG